jgi:cysteine desulfurase
LLSFCAHKLGGPKGAGALYLRRRPRPSLQPLQFGGGHERGLRSGTLALHQLAGFGTACAIAGATMAEDGARIRALRERLWLALAGAKPLWRNGAPEPSCPAS